MTQVEGGPTYTIELVAETGVVSYSLSDAFLDFGLQQFNKVVEKHFTLVNTGKIPFPFSINFTDPTLNPSLKILPLHGNLAPTQKQQFQVWVCPVLPEKYRIEIKIQVLSIFLLLFSLCCIASPFDRRERESGHSFLLNKLTLTFL